MICAQNEMTVTAYLETVYLVINDVRKSTADQLRISVRLLNRHHGKPVKLSELSELFLSQWLAAYQAEPLSSGKLRSAATIRGKRSDLLGLWRHAWNNQYTETMPRSEQVRRMKKSLAAPVAWTLDDLGKILKATDSLPGFCRKSGVRWSTWWRAYLLVAYDSALRLSDILDLRFDQIGAEFLIVQQKTGDSHMVYLTPPTLEAVKEIRQPVRKLVFEWKHCRAGFYTSFNKLVKSAGVKRGTSKFIRRSSASYVERDAPGGAAVAAHLGHRTIGLAARNYVDPTIAVVARVRPPAIE